MQTCSLHHLQQKVSSEEFAQIDISMIKLALKFPLSEGIGSRHTVIALWLYLRIVYDLMRNSVRLFKIRSVSIYLY